MDKRFCIKSFFLIAPMRSNNAYMKSMVSNSFYETSPVTAVGRTKLEKTNKLANNETNKKNPGLNIGSNIELCLICVLNNFCSHGVNFSLGLWAPFLREK